MNRVKFLLFALVAFGVLAWSLKLAPSLGADTGARNASLALASVPPTIALRLEGRRSELQAAALRLAASPALANPGPRAAKPELPTADRFNAVRTAAAEGLPDASKAPLVVLLSNEAGALMAQGPAEAGTPPEGFDVAAATAAGGAGAVVTAFGVPHLFYSLPVVVSDKNEVKAIGTAALGAPILPDSRALFGALRSELGLASLALSADGKILLSEGDKGDLETALKSLKPGAVAPIVEGAVETIGPVALPMMSGLTREVALRRPIAGTPYEVLATVSSSDGLVALAGFQKFGLGALAGLVLLSIAVTALLKSGEEEGAAMVMPPPMPAPPIRATTSQPALQPNAPLDAEPAPPAPEASPDDFDFPAAPAAPAPKPVTMQAPAYSPPSAPPEPEPTADPFANLAPAPPPAPAPAPAPVYPTSRPPPPVQTSNQPAFQPTPAPPPPARAAPPPSNPFDDEEGARTMAYPIFKPGQNPSQPPPGMDPFAMAAAQLQPDQDGGSGGGEDYNPDATRVAAVPAELIKAARSASGTTGERPTISRPGTTSAAPRVSSVIGNPSAVDEERHFQDVFKEFVATREKCGEPADGLTYDKFKAKLLKNKEQLVQKYNCKSVRFQVYVKDGKAALKASPVKD